jgi:hypothetical protein
VDELTGQNVDYVLTVCDNARESCPISARQRTESPSQRPALTALQIGNSGFDPGIRDAAAG